MTLLAIVIEVKVEIEYSRGRFEWLKIENVVDDGSAKHGLTAPGDAIEPEKGASFGFPIIKSTALDEPFPCVWMAPF